MKVKQCVLLVMVVTFVAYISFTYVGLEEPDSSNSSKPNTLLVTAKPVTETKAAPVVVTASPTPIPYVSDVGDIGDVTVGPSLRKGHDMSIVCHGHERFLGSEMNRGWFLCMEDMVDESVVYLFGVGNNGDLDEELARRYVQVFSFDPTPQAIAWANSRGWTTGLPKSGTLLPHFTPIGLSTIRGKVTMSMRGKTGFGGTVEKAVGAQHVDGTDTAVVTLEPLSVIMQRMGHTWLDLLKLNVEGHEYGILWELLRDPDSIPTCQILVEFHDALMEPATNVARYSEATLIQAFQDAHWVLWKHTTNECVFLDTKCPHIQRSHDSLYARRPKQ